MVRDPMAILPSGRDMAVRRDREWSGAVLIGIRRVDLPITGAGRVVPLRSGIRTSDIRNISAGCNRVAAGTSRRA
jgi:hypothetical protein